MIKKKQWKSHLDAKHYLQSLSSDFRYSEKVMIEPEGCG